MGMNVSAVNLYSPLIASGSFTNPLIDQLFPIWKMSRVLKASGWFYKGSGDGTGGAKDTSSNPLLDKWGPGGIVAGHVQLGTQTGAAATIGTITQGVVTINGLTGMTANSVGHALTLSGAVNSANNGTYTIVAFNSSTSVNIFNANPAVAEGTSLTWSERISGSASITWSTVAAGREQTITGLSGMTVNSASHYLYLTGSSNSNNNGVFQILKFISATSVVIINTNGASDTASGNWTELDPLLDLYSPTSTGTIVPGTQSWICLQGPSTLKIPINAPSTGTFTTGENISQPISGAQGEIIGYQFDTASSQGYLVVMPRQDGYGAGVHGWSTVASTITGGTTGASVTTANGSTPVEFVRESVFWSFSRTNGSIYHCVVDGYAESASRFSSLMLTAGCTASVAPGGGGSGSGNTFPPSPGAFVVKGTGSSTSNQLWLTSSSLELGRSSIFSANASYTANSSADGTWTLIMGYPLGITSFSPWGQFIGMGYWRVDNSEPGDVDPYVWYLPVNAAAYNDNRLGSAGLPPLNIEEFSFSSSAALTWFKGTRRRGLSSGDMMQQFQYVTLGPFIETGNPLIFTPAPDPDSIATSLAAFPQRIKEPIWVVSTQTTNTISGQPFGKMRKGTLRWGYVIAGFSGTQTFEGRKYVQLGSTTGTVTLGPWDGVSPLYQT